MGAFVTGVEPTAAPPRARRRLLIAAIAVAVAAGTCVAYSLGQGRAAVVFLVVVIALTALGYRAGATAPADPIPDALAVDDPVPGRPFPRYAEWYTHLAEGRRDRRYYDRVVRPRLHELALDRVRDRYGPAADEALARHRLGEAAWSLVDPAVRTDQPAPGPGAAELDHLLQQLERL